MPGIDPGIQVFATSTRKTWMAGHGRAEATPSFGRLCPAMTEEGGRLLHLPPLQIHHRRPIALLDDLRDPLPVALRVVAFVAEDADRAGFFNQRRELVEFFPRLR